ncbi:MAG: hypothetical protein ACTSPI_01365 [Candidatus Heimdallarchaeaceae archaeon]
MKKEFDLSEKMIKNGTQIPTIYVKEFIKRLIEKFERMEIVSGQVAKYEIKQLAGEKLK